MSGVERVKSLLGNLGKPTLRGIRRCPKCGTYNGTRGISCKNKGCDAVFKEKSERKKLGSIEAVKINTGSSSQIYSVRARDRGPDYRGFVQLPALPDDDGVEEQTLARCFMDSCFRPNASAADLIDPCQHIRATLSCETEAEPLSLKNSVLNALQVTNEVKQAIWLLATESAGPLVQRVSKNVMVVKCKINPKHPLGFLHFAFFETLRNRETPEHRFTCSCRAFKGAHRAGILKEESQKRCVHFYACLCAFSSDEKLAEEFAYFINLDLNACSVMPEQQLTAFLNDPQQSQVVPLGCKLEVLVQAELSPGNQSKKLRKDDGLAQAGNAFFNLPEPAVGRIKKSGSVPIDEATVSITFYQWLASITERINQTMHYQFDGNPEPLVFHVPQPFFDCLQQRISTGFKKKRLPNSTTAFIRKDALPLGTFSKYTWHITNVLHVKQIFDTPEMPLEVTRSFVENRDGTYDLYEPPLPCENFPDPTRRSDVPPPIRPFELKTFLKVGNTSPDQKSPTPFVIEWTPDILPKVKIGELRLQFEYGHQRNGQIEYRTPAISHIIQLQQLS